MKKYLKILKNYLWDYRVGGLLFMVETTVLMVMFFFSDMPQNVTGYLLFLHILLFALAFGISFWRYTNQYLLLEKLLAQTKELEWQEGNINLHDSHLIKKFDQLLTKQNKILQDQQTTNQVKIREYQEYYTLWVHQIKTPIFALELLMRQTENRAENSQMKAELIKIKDYSQLALQYIRMESMNADLDIGGYQLESIVKKQLKKYALLFINQKIKMELVDFEYKVVTDEKWLAFVISQILTNALKYTSAGGFIKIEMIGDQLIIEDNGLGIRPEDLPKLFQKGFTGQNGRVQKEASGMGLYLSKKVMKTLGYQIRIESEVGKGTKVYLDFSPKTLLDI